MAGHSKWANIKRKKEANDKVKGYLFTKASRLITLSVVESEGIADPGANMKLRMALEKAKLLHMPKDTIQRAIDKGMGSDHAELQEVLYGAFFFGNIASVIVCATDNPTRTVHWLRSSIENQGGKIGVQGSVSHLFIKCGLVQINKKEFQEDKILYLSEALNAFDIQENREEGKMSIYFPFEQFGALPQILKHTETCHAGVIYKPIVTVQLIDEEQRRIIRTFQKVLEANEDVQKVFTNVANI